jgi:hypothetical protein
MKHPKVIETKLGQRKADGVMEYNENTIYIDIRLRGKRKFETYIHEYLHHLHPDWSESQVDKESKLLTDFLWIHHFRNVDNK